VECIDVFKVVGFKNSFRYPKLNQKDFGSCLFSNTVQEMNPALNSN